MNDRNSSDTRYVMPHFDFEHDGNNDRVAQPERKANNALDSADPSRSTTPVPFEDRDALFDAIKSRLRQAVDERLIGQYNGAAAPLRVTVLECVDALDSLQALLGARVCPVPWERSVDRSGAVTAPGATASDLQRPGTAPASAAAPRPPATRA